MFERTVSFWRRLLGSNSVQANLANAPEDRRRSNRFSGNQEILYKPATEESGSVNFRAQLDNVSSGGIKLIVDQPLQPGDLLSIQLPTSSPDNTTWVLACVLHAQRQKEQRWALGCNFSRELSLEDLQAFGVIPKEPQDVQEQRSSPRISCELEATFQIVGEECSQFQKAKLENISLIGLGLAVAEKLPLGALLNVELHSRSGNTSKSLLCCAVHATKRPSGDWLVGCNFFAEMEETELNALLSR